MSCNSCGCPNLCDNKCINIQISDLSDIINSIDSYLCNLSETMKNALLWNHKCKGDEHEEFTKLTCYKNVLERYLEKAVQNLNQCLSEDSIQCIIENVKDIVPKPSCPSCRTDIQIDDSLENDWIKLNPYCVSYEKWNKYSKVLTADLKLTFTMTEEEVCNFALEISREIIPCEILLAAEAYKQADCVLGLNLDRTLEECKIDWELLIEKVPNCELNLKTYIELVECNVSFDIIQEVYSCGLQLEVNQKHTQECKVSLNSKLGKYPLCDLAVNSIVLKENGYNPSKKLEDFLKDYNK